MISMGQEQWWKIQQERVSGRGKCGQESASAGKYRQQQASVDRSEQRRAGQAEKRSNASPCGQDWAFVDRNRHLPARAVKFRQEETRT